MAPFDDASEDLMDDPVQRCLIAPVASPQARPPDVPCEDCGLVHGQHPVAAAQPPTSAFLPGALFLIAFLFLWTGRDSGPGDEVGMSAWASSRPSSRSVAGATVRPPAGVPSSGEAGRVPPSVGPPSGPSRPSDEPCSMATTPTRAGIGAAPSAIEPHHKVEIVLGPSCYTELSVHSTLIGARPDCICKANVRIAVSYAPMGQRCEWTTILESPVTVASGRWLRLVSHVRFNRVRFTLDEPTPNYQVDEIIAGPLPPGGEAAVPERPRPGLIPGAAGPTSHPGPAPARSGSSRHLELGHS